MNLPKKILTAVLILATSILSSSMLFGQSAENPIIVNTDELPELERLKTFRDNPIFSEYSRIVEDNYKVIKRNQMPDIIFFVHTLTEADKADLHWSDSQLISVASRCNITYDTFATLNGIQSSTDNLINTKIILPTVSGLFVKQAYWASAELPTGQGNLYNRTNNELPQSFYLEYCYSLFLQNTK